MITDYFSLGIKNLRRRGLRSWLTMIGIFISIATIFMLISVSLGLQNAVQEEFKLLGADKFFIMPLGQAGAPGSGGAVQLTTDDVDVINKVNGVKQVAYDAVGNAEVDFNSEKRFVMVGGLPIEDISLFAESTSLKIDEGSLLKKGDSGVVMLGSQYKYNSVFSRAPVIGNKIIVNGKEFKVKTILQSVGNPNDDRLVYMSIDDFKLLFNSGDRVDQIIVQIQPGTNISEVANNVERKLITFRGVSEKTKDFSILTPDQLLMSFGTILDIVTAFLVGIASISLLVGSIGIANTMYTSVLERTKEIGVMKAVGAQNKDILLIFLIESGLLGLVGGIIGVILGAAASKTIEYIAVTQLDTNLLKAALPAYLFIGCLAFSFIIGAVSGVWPAWRASHIKPVDALRYE